MHLYRLSLAGAVVDPRWLALSPRDKVTVSNQAVILKGVTLKLVQSGQDIATFPPDGTLVEVWCGADGFFVCARADEYDQAQRDRLAKAARDQHEKSRAQADRLVADRAFNQALAIPVRWVPGHKDVLSGLTEGSLGNGLNARSVVHVLFKEPLQAGRLRRNTNDFLCTSTVGTNGRQWSAQREAPESSRVTCQACIRLAARWSSSKN